MIRAILETGETILKGKDIIDFSAPPEEWEELLQSMGNPLALSAELFEKLDKLIGILRADEHYNTLHFRQLIADSMIILKERHKMEQLIEAAVRFAPSETKEKFIIWYSDIVEKFDFTVKEVMWKLAPLYNQRWEESLKYPNDKVWWYSEALDLNPDFIKNLPWHADLVFRYNMGTEFNMLLEEAENMSLFEATELSKIIRTVKKYGKSEEEAGLEIAASETIPDGFQKNSIYHLEIMKTEEGLKASVTINYNQQQGIDYRLSLVMNDGSIIDKNEEDPVFKHHYFFAIPENKEISEVRLSFTV
ncbi:MAG: hypothetical protein JXR95_10575 [Deltaproteobacteria bacterium]|nr:hypothetical protein [Deltaproteobacteria bacterium]